MKKLFTRARTTRRLPAPSDHRCIPTLRPCRDVQVREGRLWLGTACIQGVFESAQEVSGVLLVFGWLGDPLGGFKCAPVMAS